MLGRLPGGFLAVGVREHVAGDGEEPVAPAVRSQRLQDMQVSPGAQEGLLQKVKGGFWLASATQQVGVNGLTRLVVDPTEDGFGTE